MNESKIILYDDALLRKERGIKIANVVIAVIFFLYFAPILFLIVSDDNRIHEALIAIILALLLERININHLKHIESIKLYRNKTKSSQPPVSADAPAARG